MGGPSLSARDAGRLGSCSQGLQLEASCLILRASIFLLKNGNGHISFRVMHA